MGGLVTCDVLALDRHWLRLFGKKTAFVWAYR